MARIYLSPLIVDIRNKQKDTVFSKWKGINYIRSRVVPSNPKTELQIAVRESLRGLVVLWQEAYANVKLNWDEYVSGRNFSGFNDFIAKNVVKNRDGTLLTLTQDVGYDQLTIWTPSTGTASGEIDVAFAPTPVPAGKEIEVHTREVGEEGWTNKMVWISSGTSPLTIENLTPATLYEVYGYIRKEDSPTGEDIGKDSSGTGNSQT